MQQWLGTPNLPFLPQKSHFSPLIYFYSCLFQVWGLVLLFVCFDQGFFLPKQENIKVTFLGLCSFCLKFSLLDFVNPRSDESIYLSLHLLPFDTKQFTEQDNSSHTHIHPCIHSVIEQFLTVAIRPLKIKEEIYLVIFIFLPGSSQIDFWFKCFLLIHF